MHCTVSPTHYSPGSNIYTRVPTRPSTAMGGAYFTNDHQLKFSPNCAESSLIIPTTSSAGAYVYTSYGGANNSNGLGGVGLNLNAAAPDNNALASNYVLYGTTTKKQQSPSRLFSGSIAGVTGGGNCSLGSVTTPLISTANYNGFGKTGQVTTTTPGAGVGNYDEFISWESENSSGSQLVCIKGDAERTTIVWAAGFVGGQSRWSGINNRAIINLVKCGFVVNIFTSDLVNEFAITL